MSDTPITPDNNPQPITPATPQDTNTGGFTQADVDRIVGERLKRDREAQETKLKERYGVTDLSEVEKLLEAKRKADEAALSELEKAQAQIDAANRKAQDAEKRIQEMETRILNDARRGVFETAVTSNGGTNAKRLYMLVQAEKGNEFTALFGDDATSDDSKLKAFIKQVQADFPEYFGTQGAGSPSASGGIAPTSLQRATEDAKKEIEKKFGKL
jgi:hypothetical protein